MPPRTGKRRWDFWQRFASGRSTVGNRCNGLARRIALFFRCRFRRNANARQRPIRSRYRRFRERRQRWQRWPGDRPHGRQTRRRRARERRHRRHGRRSTAVPLRQTGKLRFECGNRRWLSANLFEIGGIERLGSRVRGFVTIRRGVDITLIFGWGSQPKNDHRLGLVLSTL